MAYVAVISLKHTINRLLNSSRISIVSSSREILEFAYQEVTSLQQVLKGFDDSSSRSSSKRLNALDGEIRDAVHNLEDFLEFHESNQFQLSQSESYRGEGSSSQILFLDFEEVREDIHSFVETMKKMKEEYINEIDNSFPEEEEEDDDDDAAYASSSNIDFGVKMVGFSDDFKKIKDQLLRRTRPDDFVVYPIIGMAGSCRTLVAMTLFEDLCTGHDQFFDCGAWVTIGPNHQFKEILVSIFAQILVDDPAGNDYLMLISEGDEKNIGEYLYTRLKDKRYMIVLDDIWDEQFFDLLELFPEQDNGSLVLLTTSLKEVAELIRNSFYVYQMNVLDKKMVWDILIVAMFGFIEPRCPPELEEAGKKIAENCQGLLIPLTKVILHLWKAEKTPEYWNNLAADGKNSIFMADDEISEFCQIKEELLQLCNLDNLVDDQRVLFITEVLSGMFDFPAVEPIKMNLFPKRFFSKMEIISIYGMAGIGKTALVKEIFEDASILQDIDYFVWITLGPKYQSKEVLIDILAQIYPDIDKRHMKVDTKLTKDLCGQLSYKRCLIVLDDVWSKNPLHYLKKLFPDIKGKALVTTRLAEVAQFENCDIVHKMHLLNIEESWDLFCQKVFAKGLCPPELEKLGKKISENCEGLPLLILMVANLLSKAEKTQEYWNKITKKQNPIFMNAQNELSKILNPSYNSLPQYLKACFLCMGIFPQSYEILTSKLIKLLTAEGFLEPNPSQNVEDFIAKCLSELANKSFVMVCQKDSHLRIKIYHLHFVFWHLSNSNALKNRFFHVLNTFVDNSIECLKSQCTICVRNNILLGIKDVHNSMASISTAHSLLCNGPAHQYQVPIYFNLRLLRVVDAFTIRLYEFPIEVVKLIHLRYLALTCNGKLPTSISKLWNLQHLIVSRHLSIKSSEDSSYLPIEIWDMKELKHLQIMGGHLPNPNCGSILPNLLTLLDVSAHSCTKRVFKKVPNLKRLGIQIELAPDDDGKPFHCLNRIFHLCRLESLKCVVVNPELRSKVVALPAPRSMFPSSLKKLSLCGLGYPWEHMKIIGKLKNLEVLKLRCYAFHGPKWEADYLHFTQLKFLSIEDTDLECWEHKISSFLKLEYLSIKHCYRLGKLPHLLSHFTKMIEVIDCNPFTVTWAKQMNEKQFRGVLGLETLKVHSSWDADSIKQ